MQHNINLILIKMFKRKSVSGNLDVVLLDDGLRPVSSNGGLVAMVATSAILGVVSYNFQSILNNILFYYV